jgi:hypothetical protein
MVRRIAMAVGVCAFAAGQAAAGPDWIERGDAGSRLGSAQPVLGDGEIGSISGDLSSGVLTPDLEDAYLIRILNPVAFRFDLTGVSFDTSVFLFNVTLGDEAFGALANLDSPSTPGPLLGPMANDSTGFKITNPGIYMIVIAAAGRTPVSRTGEIFFFASQTETSGPDGVGGVNPHEDWIGTGAGGSYTIDIEGTGFVDVPAPGAAAIMAVGGLMMARRRRR